MLANSVRWGGDREFDDDDDDDDIDEQCEVGGDREYDDGGEQYELGWR